MIARDGSARITIVVDPGSAVRTITNTAQVSSELRDPDASDNSASATTQVVALQPATIVVRKVTVPSPDPTDTGFGLTAGGGLSPVSFTLNNGESRTFANLAPRAGYSLAETTPEGWDLLSATCSDGSPLSNIDLSPNETVTCTFTNRRRGTIILHKVTDPAPDSGDTSFGFTAGGGLSPASFSLKNGESRTFANLVPQSSYSLAETTPPSGWDLISATCSDGSPIANVDVAPGETVTCTFTNTKRGSVTLRKTTDGVVDPSKDILFVLSGPGLPSAGVTRSTFGDQDGVLDFGSGNLIPAQTYTICETPVPAGFTSFWKLDGAIVTPYNPSASQIPAEDLGIRCSDFSLTPGQARAFEVDNSHPGGDPRTIGYWKNWNRCTGVNQAATAQKNGGGAASFFLVEDAAIDLPSYTGSVSIPSRWAQRRMASIVFSSGIPYVPACHSSRSTISESSSSRPSSIASAVARAMRAICAHVCSTVAEASIPSTARSVSCGGEAGHHPRLCRSGYGADDDRVEREAELPLLLGDLVGPACEPEPTERVVGGAGRNCIRLAAALLDRRERVLPAPPDPDVETRAVEPHVRTHDAREQQVADLVVDDVRPLHPALLHEDAAKAEPCRHGRNLTGVVRLHAADRDERVASLREGFCGEILELAHLVAAVGEARVAVLPLRPDVDRAAEVLAQTLQPIDR